MVCRGSSLIAKMLTYEQAPQRFTELIMGLSENSEILLLMIVTTLYVLRMFMEPLSTISIWALVLLPMIKALGTDPIYFLVIFM